jgi:hypothetical protein
MHPLRFHICAIYVRFNLSIENQTQARTVPYLLLYDYDEKKDNQNVLTTL